jgi:hypothetical protein
MTRERQAIEALENLLREARSALQYLRATGMKPNHPPAFLSCTPYVLRTIEQTCLHALGYDPEDNQ